MNLISFVALFGYESLRISSPTRFLDHLDDRILKYSRELYPRPICRSFSEYRCSIGKNTRYNPNRFRECLDFHSGRQIIVGDVHGCKSEMVTLMDALKFNAEKDRLIFVGDLIAKGPDSLGCLKLAHSIGAVMALGNHELKTLNMINSLELGHCVDTHCEHAVLAKMLLEDRNDQLLRYLKAAPVCVSMNDSAIFVVHAGLMPDTKPEDNTITTLTTMRSVVVGDGGWKPSSEAGERPWAESWKGPETVVFGHDAARGLQIYPKAYGLDSGCVYGGQLSALVFPDESLVSVPARQAYCPIRVRVRNDV